MSSRSIISTPLSGEKRPDWYTILKTFCKHVFFELLLVVMRALKGKIDEKFQIGFSYIVNDARVQ